MKKNQSKPSEGEGEGKSEYMCNACGVSFSSRSELDSHNESMHASSGREIPRTESQA